MKAIVEDPLFAHLSLFLFVAENAVLRNLVELSVFLHSEVSKGVYVKQPLNLLPFNAPLNYLVFFADEHDIVCLEIFSNLSHKLFDKCIAQFCVLFFAKILFLCKGASKLIDTDV